METVRVFVDGVFDMYHYGHARLFQQVKSLPRFANMHVHLIVGVHSDAECTRHKGKTPVLSALERAEMVGQCRWVDEVMCNTPWGITELFLNANRIDYVAHDGEPYPSEGYTDIYAIPKRLGRFISTDRTPGISTSDLLVRISSRLPPASSCTPGQGVGNESV